MDRLSDRIERRTAVNKVKTEIECELIRMRAEEEVARIEEAGRRIAARRKKLVVPSSGSAAFIECGRKDK